MLPGAEGVAAAGNGVSAARGRRPCSLIFSEKTAICERNGTMEKEMKKNEAGSGLTLSREAGAFVGRFKGKEVIRVPGDGAALESRRQLVSVLREMLIHLPPEDAAQIAAHGIALAFDAPGLVQSLQEELMLKVVPGAGK